MVKFIMGVNVANNNVRNKVASNVSSSSNGESGPGKTKGSSNVTTTQTNPKSHPEETENNIPGKYSTNLDVSHSNQSKKNGKTKTKHTSKSAVPQAPKNESSEKRIVDVETSGPFFCYLMIQLGGPCKNEAKVLVSRECFEDAYKHNSGEINDKGTKAARGLWQVEMIVGPFDSKSEADDFKKLWMQDSRGIGPRRDRAIELINQGKCAENVKCFDKRLVPVNLNGWLVMNDMACLVLPDDRLTKLYNDCALSTKKEDGHTFSPTERQ